MMKKILISFILSLFVICASAHQSQALTVDFDDITSLNFDQIGALTELTDNITTMAGQIYKGSSQMMKYADMLKCYAEHGKGAFYSINLLIFSISIHWIEPWTWLASLILLVIGFLIMMIASFYMFDISFNIAVSLFLLPLGLALWPFGWTRDKLKTVLENIVYYTGLFIFLPLGIAIATSLVTTVIDDTLARQTGTNGRSFAEIFKDGQSDILQKSFSIFSMGFYVLLMTYIVAMYIIPLMAGEFCSHFFGNALLGSPISDKITNFVKDQVSSAKNRAGKYAKDVAKHQVGSMIKNHSSARSSNFLSRVMHRYGSNMAKTKK